MTITLKITETTESLDLASKYIEDINIASKTLIPLLKLSLFIMKKVASGSNCVELVPSLKKKLDELWFEYLEEIENATDRGIMTEGRYLEFSAGSVKERANTLELLDMLELGLVIKCIII